MDSFWDFFWFIISFFLLMAYLMVLFQIVGDLFRDKDTSGVMKAVWIFFLIILPILTSLVYLIARGQSMAERNVAALQAAQHDQEAYIRKVTAGASPSDEIARAKSLLDSGAISPEEFEKLKGKALT
jgi:ABC-type transport system involved in multi-copper enzyme maturation permease subunit